MNWIGILVIILLLNTILLASLLFVFLFSHFKSEAHQESTPLPDPFLSGLSFPSSPSLSLLSSPSLSLPSSPLSSSPCPLCPLLQQTTKISLTTTTTVTTASIDSQALLFKLLDAYLEKEKNRAPSYEEDPHTTTECPPAIDDLNIESMIERLRVVENQSQQHSSPQFPLGSSSVCSVQKDIESTSRCSQWRISGYCDHYPTTLHLLCKKTCLCYRKR